MLVLDSGAVSRLAEHSRRAVEQVRQFRGADVWPPVVPSVVLIECLRGHSGRDAPTNRLLKSCEIRQRVSEAVARRAAWLRTKARRGSAVDALLVALAEPGGIVLTSDPRDLTALAAHAEDVAIERV